MVKRVFICTPGSQQLQGESCDSGGPNMEVQIPDGTPEIMGQCLLCILRMCLQNTFQN